MRLWLVVACLDHEPLSNTQARGDFIVHSAVHQPPLSITNIETPVSHGHHKSDR